MYLAYFGSIQGASGLSWQNEITNLLMRNISVTTQTRGVELGLVMYCLEALQLSHSFNFSPCFTLFSLLPCQSANLS